MEVYLLVDEAEFVSDVIPVKFDRTKRYTHDFSYFLGSPAFPDHVGYLDFLGGEDDEF